MPRRFWFSPSMVHPKTRIIARCMTCRNIGYLNLAALTEQFGDVPLYTLEPRLRCTFRGYDGKREPCGRPGKLDVWPEVERVTPTEIVHYPVCRSDALAHRREATNLERQGGIRSGP